MHANHFPGNNCLVEYMVVRNRHKWMHHLRMNYVNNRSVYICMILQYFVVTCIFVSVCKQALVQKICLSMKARKSWARFINTLLCVERLYWLCCSVLFCLLFCLSHSLTFYSLFLGKLGICYCDNKTMKDCYH